MPLFGERRHAVDPGAPVVGKGHLSVAIGREAIRSGCLVVFNPAMVLIVALGEGAGGLKKKLIRCSKPKLFCIDETGSRPRKPQAAHLLFALVYCR